MHMMLMINQIQWQFVPRMKLDEDKLYIKIVEFNEIFNFVVDIFLERQTFF